MDFNIINDNNDRLNDFVSKNKHGTIFQTSHMFDIYHNVPNCDVISLAAVDDTDEILATLVGVKFVEKGGIFKYFSTHSSTRGGPIWVDTELGEKAAISLIKRYNKIQKNNVVYDRIYPFFENDLSKILCKCGYQREDDLNFLIDLNKSEEDIWNSMHKKRRYGVRKAKENVAIKEAENYGDLKSFYELLKETSDNAKIPIKNFKLFCNIYDKLIPKGMAKLFLATHNGTCIAGILVLTYKNIIYDWYAGSTRKFISLYPNDYLVWHVLLWGSRNGYTTFNFGGAGSPHKKYGVREFKKSFGGKLVNCGIWTKTHSQMKMQIVEFGFKVYKKILYRI